MPKLTLVSISCMQTDETDKDEIYLKVGEKKIWPLKPKFYAIDIDEQVEMNLNFKVSAGKVCIDLWEYDYFDKNEILGSFVFKIGEPGSFSEMMSNLKGDSSYVLNYEVS